MHQHSLSCITLQNMRLNILMILPSGIRHPCIQGIILVARSPKSKFRKFGTKTYENNSSFFLRFSYDDLRTTDPKRSGLYPFMVAASGNTSDLSAVNCLLKRDPSIVYVGKSHLCHQLCMYRYNTTCMFVGLSQ